MMRLDARTLSQLSTVHCHTQRTKWQSFWMYCPRRYEYIVFILNRCAIFFSPLSIINHQFHWQTIVSFWQFQSKISAIVFVRRWQLNSRAKEIANWFATMSFCPNMHWFLWKCPKKRYSGIFWKMRLSFFSLFFM